MGLNIQMAIRKNRLFIRLSGELDQAVTENLKIKVSEIINKYMIKHVIINFSKLSFMDSSGIGFIIGRYTQVKRRDGKVVICSMNEIIERIVKLSGLKRICLIASSEEEAEQMLEVA
ncbi:MAG: anti-sigma factor antagonist [Bacilli bacterium]|nr:anti-sigma factor antagonist [Bacilli bacterium]MDD7315253.1 anti-sigma factor antagonist [Bacilli bacterium]MDY4051742.1 anti-sigma factor antagonist [Bacilli bacterium]